MAVLSMSKQEFSRLDVLLRVQSGRLRVAGACTLMGLHHRQMFRLLRGLKQDSASSLLSKRRGKPSNHRLPSEVRTLALSIVRERYADFDPTLAAEKLAEHHGCSVSHETLRGWMIADGLWIDRRHRLASPHQPRRRRDCLGELSRIVLQACCRSGAASQAIIGFRARFAPLHCPSSASGMQTLTQPSRPRSWRSITAVRSRMRRYADG